MRMRSCARGVVGAVLCVTLTACSGWTGGGASPSARSTEAVVGTQAPTDAWGYTRCPGISDEALEAMFGPDYYVTTYPRNGQDASVCWVKVRGERGSVLSVEFWYVYGGRDPWETAQLPMGRYGSDFSFEGVEGSGRANVDKGPDARYGSTVFTCGDHYLALGADNLSPMKGDPRANLINLTQSALPWLCGDEPIPGLGRTMEEIRPPYAQPTTDAATTPADTSAAPTGE